MGNDFLQDEAALSVRASRPEVSVLLYPGCILFEIALALEQVANHFTVRFYTPLGDSHHSSQGFELQPHGSYETLRAVESVAVLVPGGDSRGALSAEHSVKEALQAQLHRGTLIAAICAGNLVLAYAGILDGRRGTHNFTPEHASQTLVDAASQYWGSMIFERADLVIDGNVITAQPWAYRDYAAAVTEYLHIVSSEQARELLTYPERRRYNNCGSGGMK
jgi:transcriptional regulator GlxA family with amidase domain